MKPFIVFVEGTAHIALGPVGVGALIRPVDLADRDPEDWAEEAVPGNIGVFDPDEIAVCLSDSFDADQALDAMNLPALKKSGIQSPCCGEVAVYSDGCGHWDFHCPGCGRMGLCGERVPTAESIEWDP